MSGDTRRMFHISFSKNYRTEKRAKFKEVCDSFQEQFDDMGGDLTDALLIAPEGCSPRQAILALQRLNRKIIPADTGRRSKKVGRR
jgi:hypothetical protein